jgi:IclR family KDG regulon transcriptional repressor
MVEQVRIPITLVSDVKLVSAMRNSDSSLRSVATALELLRRLGSSEGSIGVTEVAHDLGVAPSTAHRMLSTLVAEGFAIRVAGRRYRRGPAVLRLPVRRPVAVVVVRDVARPTLEALSRMTGETTHLAIIDGLDVIGVDHVEGQGAVVYHHPVGSRVPAHATAVGLALLAHSPEAAEALVAEGLTRMTDTTLPHGEALRATLAEVRERGYAINDRGWHPETAGVASPILDRAGEAVAALGISGPAARLATTAELARLGRLTRSAAQDLSARLPDAVRHPGRVDPTPAGR